VPGSVTVFGRVNHLGAESGTTQPEPAEADWVPGVNWESKQAYRVIHQLVFRGLAVFAECLASGWLAEISADLREAVAH